MRCARSRSRWPRSGRWPGLIWRRGYGSGIAPVLPEPLRKRFAKAAFAHQGEQWADRIRAGGSVRCDIAHHPSRGRWYLDAPWATVKRGQKVPTPSIEAL
ncbi:hypothetical protein [Streptomyces sp. NPDC059262]|uniref:hypothetical protein n=1 Tax=Streptomyces sp. NPDC059262 TaxID=3346797 RepID=UPI0036864187